MRPKIYAYDFFVEKRPKSTLFTLQVVEPFSTNKLLAQVSSVGLRGLKLHIKQKLIKLQL